MSTIGREGLGFRYEDSVRTSALIHMYAKFNFLNIDENIIAITLGVAKLNKTTDDLLIETENKKIFIQIKSEITGFADKQFTQTIFNAYQDHKNDLSQRSFYDKEEFYYLVSKRLSVQLFSASRVTLNNIHGCSFEQYRKISRDKQEIDFIDKIKTITECNDDYMIYNFLRKLYIIEKSTDLEYRLETDVPILSNIFSNNKDPVKCFKLLYNEIEHLKQKNSEITYLDASKIFSKINLNKKNYSVDLFSSKVGLFINFLNIIDKDFNNIDIIAEKIINLNYELEVIEINYLNELNILTKKILKDFEKIIIAMTKDINMLKELINIKNIDKIDKLDIIPHSVIKSKKKFLYYKCLEDLLSSDINYINNIYSEKYSFESLSNGVYKAEILHSGDLSFYKKSNYLHIINGFILLINDLNTIDGFFYSMQNIFLFKMDLAVEKSFDKSKKIKKFIEKIDVVKIKSFIYHISRNSYLELIILRACFKNSHSELIIYIISMLDKIREKFGLFINVIKTLCEYDSKNKKYQFHYSDYLVKATEVRKNNDVYELVDDFFKYIYFLFYKYTRTKIFNEDSVHSFLTNIKSISNENAKYTLIYFLMKYIE